MLLACFVAFPPHCDFCDGPSSIAFSFSTQRLADHPKPAVPDSCNGICWCCGFHALPHLGVVLNRQERMIAAVRFESPTPVRSPLSAIFRPPRMVLSA